MWALTTPRHVVHMDNSRTARSMHLPCLFLLAAIANTAQPKCRYPLHLPLADFIDSQSNSSGLFLLLSRFGVCVSRDTFQRHKTSVVLERSEEGLQKDVLTGAFSIVSIDNMDRLAPGQKITIQSGQRGFHGTSVEHVSPRPATCRLTPAEVPREPLATAAQAGIFATIKPTPSVSRRASLPRTTTEGQTKCTIGGTADSSSNQQCSSVSNQALSIESVRNVPDHDLEQYRFTWYRRPQENKRPLDKMAIITSPDEQCANGHLGSEDPPIYVPQTQGRRQVLRAEGLPDAAKRRWKTRAEEIYHHHSWCNSGVS